MNILMQYVDHSRMRQSNLALILSCLREFQPLSRSQMAEITGLTKATVSSLVKELIERKFVCETGQTSSEVGRPSINLELNPEAGCIIGAEIGVDYLSAILTNFAAEIQWRKDVSTIDILEQNQILNEFIQLLNEAKNASTSCSGNLLGIGIGVPGLVDGSNGTLLYAPNLKWNNVPIEQILEREFHVPVYVDNEANMAALGETLFGAARDSDFVLYLSTGIGLGGGIILDKQIFQGLNGFAGEIGHMTIDPNGSVCGCGNIGCWETLVSQRALFKRIGDEVANGKPTALMEYNLNRLTVDNVVSAAQGGDSVAREVLEETGHYLGIGVANLINALNPQVVVLGGVYAVGEEYIVPFIQAEIDRRALLWPRRNIRIVPAFYGHDSVVMGAVGTVYQRILTQPNILS